MGGEKFSCSKFEAIQLMLSQLPFTPESVLLATIILAQLPDRFSQHCRQRLHISARNTAL